MEKQGARYEDAQGISEMTPNTPSPQEKPTVEQCIAYVENEIAGRYKGPPDVEVLRFILSRLRASQAPAGECVHRARITYLRKKLVAIGNREQDAGNDGTGCIEVLPDDELQLSELDEINGMLAELASLPDCAAPTPAKCKTCDELRKQIAALSKIDEKGIGHDDAVSSIASHVHEIQVLCDAFGYDPSQWLQDEVANDCAAPQAAIESAARGVVPLKRYRVSYKHGVISDDGSHYSSDTSKPLYMADEVDRLLAAEREERERITRDRDAKTSRMWELGKQCDQLQQEVAGLKDLGQRIDDKLVAAEQRVEGLWQYAVHTNACAKYMSLADVECTCGLDGLAPAKGDV
jgi:hypothetical protein